MSHVSQYHCFHTMDDERVLLKNLLNLGLPIIHVYVLLTEHITVYRPLLYCIAGNLQGEKFRKLVGGENFRGVLNQS